MKEQPRTCKLCIFEIVILNKKMKRLQISQKPVFEKSYLHEKILRTRNSRRNFTKILLPKKRKESM